MKSHILYQKIKQHYFYFFAIFLFFWNFNSKFFRVFSSCSLNSKIFELMLGYYLQLLAAVSDFSIIGDFVIGDFASGDLIQFCNWTGDFDRLLGAILHIGTKYLTCSSIVTSYFDPIVIYLPFLSYLLNTFDDILLYFHLLMGVLFLMHFL